MKKGKGRGREKLRHPWRPLYWMPVLTVVFCMILAKLILWGKVSESSVAHGPRIIGALTGALGAYRGARIAPRQRLLWGISDSALYGGILMLGNLLFFGEGFSMVGSMFLWILGGGTCGAVLAGAKRSKTA